MSRSVEVLAHRCGMGRGTENTMEAIAQAFLDGAHRFECDVRLTEDGVPVVIHDADLKRLAGHSGVIAQMAKHELDQVRLRGGEKIPSVSEVMDFVRKKYWRVTFEIKDRSVELVQKMFDLAVEYNLRGEHCELLVFAENGDWLAEIKSREKEIIGTSVMLKVPWQIRAAAKRFGTRTICLGWLGWPSKLFFHSAARIFSLKEEIEKAHDEGIKVIAGITNHSAAVEYLVDLGVDGIYTNNVPRVRQLLKI